MKNSLLFSLLVLSLLFTSCLEEESSLSSPAASSPLANSSRTIVSPAAMVGLQFSMAEINLEATSGSDFHTTMPACLLTVEETNLNTASSARIDEDNSTLFIRNTVSPAARNTANTGNTEVISFSLDNEASNRGFLADFLRREVFVHLKEADWTVSQEGRNFYLNCSNCPVEYNGRTYINREIRLRP